MTKDTLFENTVKALSKLPKSKLSEVSDFIEFILSNREKKLKGAVRKNPEKHKPVKIDYSKYTFPVSNLKFDRAKINER
jgi:hypothetical protein